MTQDILNTYRKNAANAQAEANRFKKLANKYSLMRLGVFALFIAGVSVGVAIDNFAVIAITSILLISVFVALVKRQSEFERERDYFTDLVRINENEIANIEQYDNLYDDGDRFGNDKHFYTSDLDIFGKASLFNLINRTATVPGNNKLAVWLSAPADKQAILQRQEALRELSRKSNWKLELQALLLFAKTADVAQLSNLVKYLGMPLDMPGESWIKKYCRVAPFITVVAIILSAYFGVKLVWLVAVFGHLGLVASRGAQIKKADLVIGKIGATLGKYAQAFKKAEDEQWQSPYCAGLSNQLKEKQTSAEIKELSVLINKFNSRLNMLVGAVLNIFFLWDLKQIIAIEEWKRANKQNLADAFEVLAEYEALISLASLHINYSHWAMPQIADGEAYTLAAKNIGHPLIQPNKRVVNSYELRDAFKVDIITGSNMAGKSTFLRTIGINTVLALCGAPVCADAMEVSVVNIISYMRIKDSLNESTSTFKAELDRLQMLLKAVGTIPKVFFLVDEMLRGTNSVDKYLGSKAVIEQLIAKNAVGMVATHDLQIARLEDKYPAYVSNYYFDIQVINGEMLFDYKLKHGECKTFNASLLLKQIGINVAG
ncbi:DNA mismatch repair protein MutS [Mucilaginibacter roseus]|uniref:DNA mismatch repair protein MutS n=1 Tax=Mucilaginibacter roseus TaxID=1528868 RepID=A0ABS8U0P4_9SPHI|nr:DNA mismatch repair protein MutS [Mucilaginibacter roseus]MCD8740676.1 DNA mismatch repair protein MutS [Mucilaginibacter roseus]